MPAAARAAFLASLRVSSRQVLTGFHEEKDLCFGSPEPASDGAGMAWLD